MAFGVLAGQITVIFLEVLLGYVGARSGIIKDRDSKFLSDFIMKLLLPCTMLAGAAVDGEPELLTQAGVLFVLLLALFVVTTGLCRLSSWLHHDTPGKYAVLVGTAAMPNCGFIGLPLCSALLGTARGTVFAGMAMASYNVWFFTYVVCLFRPGEKIRLKTFITPTNIATVAMLGAAGHRLAAARTGAAVLQCGGRLHHPAGAHDRRCAAGRQRHPCAAAHRFPVPGHPAARHPVPAAVHAAAVAAAAGQCAAHRPVHHRLLPGRQPCRCAGQTDRHRGDPCQSGGGPLHRVYAGHGACHAAANGRYVPDVRSCKKARCLWTAGFLLL